jgi:hypothetical protein|tara:strand:- start:42 stop:1391 length:1350 start_codon:yes stop_codon:yes gene_type:complete
MVTVSPYYKQRNVLNPFYTVSKTVDGQVSKLTGIAEPLYKNTEKGVGKLILDTRGKFIFQIYNGNSETKSYITVRKSDIIGHYGMKGRKDTTASSNVNEFLSVFFLINKYNSTDYLSKLEINASKFGNKSTGVLNPSSGGFIDKVTYEQLAELIDKDETAERDIKIGYNNSLAIKKDLQNQSIKQVYWCPRGKPPGVSPKNPSDVVVQISNDDYIGYSNKISEGKDETPKFNTNMYAYFGKLQNSSQLKAAMNIIDTAWDQASKQISKDKKLVIGALKEFNIRKEKYSESASSKVFSELATVFRAQRLDFYTDGFYYNFRNNLIKNLGKHLLRPENLIYFLNTIYFYTYDDPRVKSVPCPYKLLIGKENAISEMKDVSSNADLKNVLIVKKPNQLQQIKFDYDNKSQSFKMSFVWKKKKVILPITCRTRAAGGWQGKSLFITTSGLKIS